jgi:hypothetical protein
MRANAHLCVCVCVRFAEASLPPTNLTKPTLTPTPAPTLALTSWLCSTRASPRALARAALCMHVPVRTTDPRPHCPLNCCRSCATAPVVFCRGTKKKNLSAAPHWTRTTHQTTSFTTLAHSPSHHASSWPPRTLPMVQTRVAHRGETTSAKSMDDLEMKIATLEQAVRSGVIGSGGHQVSSTPFCTHALQLACD